MISHDDIRQEPRYSLAEAARYLRVSPTTLRSWVWGRPYPVTGGRKHSRPLVDLASPRPPEQFSFVNLVEAHVLAAMRQKHRIPMGKIRMAVEWLRRKTGSAHPLLDLKIDTDGLDLFIEELGRLISASEQGQVVIKDVILRYLSRIEVDRRGHALLFYPLTQDRVEGPKRIVINPEVAFGRPVIKGTRITSAFVMERYKAGESIQDLAKDYDLPPASIEEAVRSELDRAA